nr:unknown [Chondromyces crocatus]
MEDGHFVEEAEALHDAHAESAEDYKAIQEVMAFYEKLEIPPDLLATITSLVPDGGDLAYMHAVSVWDGEDDLFDITSLDGIEHLINLEVFAPIAMIGEGGIDYTPLLGCKKLKRVDVSFASEGEKNESVKEALEKRGVEIEE